MMPDEEWRALDEEGLERLLVERWLYRGILLAVIFAAAITVTWLGTRGLESLKDQITVGVLLALAVAAGVMAFSMRQQDLRIMKEMRQRRAPRAP